MNVYSKQRKIKIILMLISIILITLSLWFSNSILKDIKLDEQKKLKIWIETILHKENMVKSYEKLYKKIEKEELSKVELWKEATQELAKPDSEIDFSFIIKVVQSNKTIPLILVDENNSIIQTKNLDSEFKNDSLYQDSLLTIMKQKYPPIEITFNKNKNFIYYNNSKLYYEIQSLTKETINSFLQDIVLNNSSIPVVLTNKNKDSLIATGNISEIDKNLKLNDLIIKIKPENPPKKILLANNDYGYLYYGPSKISQKLNWAPYLQVGFPIIFLFIAYLILRGFNNIEQNSIWVGMAKETAHQLGTPISSLMGWIEIIKDDINDKSYNEINKDINRLEEVASRFSKIGSAPKLHKIDLNKLIENVTFYMEERTSKRVNINYQSFGQKAFINGSNELISWVIENIIRNAVDAIQNKGNINIKLFRKEDTFFIHIEDNGKGMNRKLYKNIFKPGLTTKERGWGLGLSLSKRIITQYHHGKIYIINSEINKGTTFGIELKAT